VSEVIIEKILEETLKKGLESLYQKGKSEHERQKAFKKNYQVLHRKVLLLSISLRHFQKNLK
jgi:hypothetical protein